MQNNSIRFLDLLSSIQRPGVEELIEYLKNSDFFTSPASTRFHGAYAGGLVEHSLNVYDAISFLYANLVNPESAGLALPEISEESLILVALLHDVCKVNTYKEDTKNVKNERGVWEQVPYFKREPKLPMGHAGKSLFILQNFIFLTTEEALAIYWHMGAYDTSNYNTYDEMSQAYGENLLAFLLHQADMFATYILENDNYQLVKK